jgi:hypothetical protein
VPALPAGSVGAKGGAAVGRGGDQARAPAPDALTQEPAPHLERPLQPEVVGRHRHHRILVEERHERGDVVALEGVDVAGEEGPVLGVEAGGGRGALVTGGEGGPGPLEHAVHRGHAGAEQLGHLAGLPAQDLPQDEHRPLAGGQVLEGGDEGQADALARRRHLGRIAVLGHDAGVGDGRDPRLLGPGGPGEGTGAARRAEVHGQGPALAASEHVEADVGGDAVDPRAHGRPALEALDPPPGPHHGLLHRVVSLEARPQHAVAVAGQLPAVVLQVLGPELLGGDGGGAGVTAGHPNRVRKKSC